ncbi:MAG TPA: nuclear transport factor 2 family protein [Sphingobacteriaceae bacterium]
MKKYVFLLLAATVAASCKPSGKSPGPESTARAVFEEFNAHNWSAMEELYDNDVIFTDPAYPEPKKGKEGMTDWYKTVPDIYDEVKAVYVSGDVVTVQFVSTGTENGKKFKKSICSVLIVRNGKIIKDDTYYDL